MEGLRGAVSRLRDVGVPTPRVALLLDRDLGAPMLIGPTDPDPGLELSMDQIAADGEVGPFPGGELVIGRLEGVAVAAWSAPRSRFEPATSADLAFAVRLLRLAGADVLVTAGSCGALDPLWSPGEIVVVDDHINLTGENPLTGPNLDAFGPRFPDLSATYDEALQASAQSAAHAEGLVLKHGVYVAVPGPNLETPAEYRMLRSLGGDVVGTGIVPEAIVARHAGMRVLALSVVTDRCLAEGSEPVDPERVRGRMREAAPRLGAIVRRVVARLA